MPGNISVEAIEEAKSHAIVCRYERSEINSSVKLPNVQVFLDPVSNESLQIARHRDEFKADSVSGKVLYICWADDIAAYIEENAPKDLPSGFSESNLKEKKKFLDTYLKGKLIVINPFYRKDTADREKYVKRVDKTTEKPILDIVETKDKDSRYMTIPRISESDVRPMERGEAISLSNWDCRYFGLPPYLDTGNSLIHCEFKYSDTNAVQIKPGTQIVRFPFQSEPLTKEGYIIDPYLDYSLEYRFFSQKGIVKIIKESLSKKRTEAVIKKEETPEEEEENPEERALAQLRDYMKTKGLEYSIEDITNFHTCVKSGVITILAGMSGTGKTRLPLEYASFFNMTEDTGRLLFLPVSPGLIEPSDILGFYNPTDHSYMPDEYGLVDFLVRASQNPDKTYMVIFEEMNLSRVEHWFAPFLAALERGPNNRYIRLYSDSVECTDSDRYPPRVKLGSNVIIVGTADLDQSADDLSDRILDRSMVITLRKPRFSRLSNSARNIPNTDRDSRHSSEELMDICKGSAFDTPYYYFNYIQNLTATQIEFFDRLHDMLNKSDPSRGISFRTLRNISLYLKCCPLSDSFTEGRAFDYAVRQTIIRKLRGTEKSLSILLDDATEGSLEALFDQERFSSLSDFHNCREDIDEKRRVLEEYGFIR